VVVRTTGSTGSTVNATASVVANEDPAGGNNSLSQTTTIDDGADLVLTKTASPQPPATVVAGANATFTLGVTNAGPNDAVSLTVTDTLPTNMTYVSATGTGWSCGNAGQVVTCTRSDLANGVSAPDISIVGRVTGAVTGTLTNTATVSATTADPDPNNTVTANVLVIQGTDLGVTKSVSPTTVISGQTATFTLTPVNNGPFTATTVSVSDTLPAGFSFLTASGSGWTCGNAGQVVTCTRASFSVGASVPITLTATADTVVASQSFTNHVEIDSADSPDPVSGNDQQDLNFTVAPDGVDLSVTKTKTPDPVAEGANMTSTIRVANGGPRAAGAGSISITETLSASETFVSGTGSNWSCGGPVGNVVTCTYSAALAMGAQTPDLMVVTTAGAAGALANTACAVYSGVVPGDAVAANDCQTRSVTSTASALSADLAISKIANAGGDTTLADTESAITYTLVVTNNGPGDADGVVVTDTIPGHVTGTGVTASLTGSNNVGAQPTFNCTTGSTVTCTQTGGVIENGRTATFTVTVTRPLTDGPLINTASVTSTTLGDPITGNNSAQATVTVARIADVEMQTKNVTPATVKAGVNATYVLTFRNKGPSSADGVTVADVFTVPFGDAGFTLVSVTPSQGSCAGMTVGDSFGLGTHTLNCAVGSMASGGSETVTVVVRPNWQSGQVGNRTLGNTATIDTTTPESVGDVTNNGNNSQSASLTIEPAEVDVLVNKTDTSPAGPDPLGYDSVTLANNVITYKVRITNRGPSLATGVVFTDSMTPPASKTITFEGDDGSIGGVDANICDNVGATSGVGTALNLTCTLASSLPANTSVDRYLRFLVNEAPVTGGSIYSNSATVRSNETDSTPGNNIEGETTTVRARADLAVTKGASISPVQMRQPFNWIITVTNNGPGDSQQTSVSDTLPSGVVFFGAAPTWSNSGGSSGSCATSGQIVTCNFGLVTNGQIVTVTVPSRVTSYAATKQNCATATTSEVDPASGNNTTRCFDLSVQRSSLAGFVYNDANDDGSKVGGESGINAVSVRLTGTDAYGNAVDTTVATDGTGAFLFSNLSPSDGAGYTLTETQPTNFVDGLDNKAGSVIDGSRLTDTMTAIALAGDTAATGYLFGELADTSISGNVWFDADNDGVKDAGETTGVPGVTITLTGTDDLGNPVNLSTTTNASGVYSFTGLRPGTYSLTETQPSAWVDGLDALGSGATSAGTLGADTVTGIVLASGQSATGYNFGELGGSLAGRVYNDQNISGSRDPGEPGIPSVTLTLAGTDANGQAVSRTTTTGADGTYTFAGLPVPNGSGYTISETQPGGFNDGGDTVGNLGGTLGADSISGITFPAAGATGTGYDFGEVAIVPAQVSGSIWLDADHDRVDNDAACGTRCAGWTVQIIQRASPTATSFTEIARTTSDANGDYSFPALIPGTYEIRFLHPDTGHVFGNAQSSEPGVDLTHGTIYNLTLNAGANVVNQNLPLDPAGVVYDAVTRLPVAGAVITLACPLCVGFDAGDVVGGSLTQTTGADGFYQFLLNPTAPNGDYTLTVTTYPAGYLPLPSTMIPVCAGTLVVGAGPPNPALIQNSNLAPAIGVTAHNPVACEGIVIGGSATTQYFSTLNLTIGTSANVVNNHIPLDPILGGAIVMTKTTPLQNVSKGDLVPYTLTATNTLAATLSNIDIQDQIPPGFKYKTGSATLDDDCSGPLAAAALEPTVSGRLLTWANRSLTATGTAQSCERIRLMLVVGSGVGEGEYTNVTWALNNLVSTRVSNTATATVRIVPDPTFDCTDIIGKVFDDQNANGYQDEGEPGIANVRLATARGLLVTTDKDGRFHVACAVIPQAQRGSNFFMKLDERSLPSGYRITTENPREVRATRGKLVKLNFGASIHRVIRIELSDSAFVAGKAEAAEALAEALLKLPETLRGKPSVVRLAYRKGGEEPALMQDRLRSVRQRLEELWQAQGCCYTLVFEEEIFERAVNKKGGAK
jgi:uncharacterized repeat protein (TIGR01451 family)